jgi:hypothetical protein
MLRPPQTPVPDRDRRGPTVGRAFLRRRVGNPVFVHLFEHRRHLPSSLVNQADAIVRNWAALEHITPGWSRPESPDADPSPTGDGPIPRPNRFDDFISRSFVLLLEAIRFHPDWCSRRVTHQPALRLLLAAAAETRRLRFATLTSAFADEGPDLRVNDTPVLCWWDDQPIPGVKTYALGPLFRDLALGHMH